MREVRCEAGIERAWRKERPFSWSVDMYRELDGGGWPGSFGRWWRCGGQEQSVQRRVERVRGREQLRGQDRGLGRDSSPVSYQLTQTRVYAGALLTLSTASVPHAERRWGSSRRRARSAFASSLGSERVYTLDFRISELISKILER